MLFNVTLNVTTFLLNAQQITQTIIDDLQAENDTPLVSSVYSASMKFDRWEFYTPPTATSDYLVAVQSCRRERATLAYFPDQFDLTTFYRTFSPPLWLNIRKEKDLKMFVDGLGFTPTIVGKNGEVIQNLLNFDSHKDSQAVVLTAKGGFYQYSSMDRNGSAQVVCMAELLFPNQNSTIQGLSDLRQTVIEELGDWLSYLRTSTLNHDKFITTRQTVRSLFPGTTVNHTANIDSPLQVEIGSLTADALNVMTALDNVMAPIDVGIFVNRVRRYTSRLGRLVEKLDQLFSEPSTIQKFAQTSHVSNGYFQWYRFDRHLLLNLGNERLDLILEEGQQISLEQVFNKESFYSLTLFDILLSLCLLLIAIPSTIGFILGHLRIQGLKVPTRTRSLLKSNESIVSVRPAVAPRVCRSRDFPDSLVFRQEITLPLIDSGTAVELDTMRPSSSLSRRSYKGTPMYLQPSDLESLAPSAPSTPGSRRVSFA